MKMFEFIRGLVTCLTPSKAVVDVGGVGYKVFISLKTFQSLSTKQGSILFFISFVVKEDSHSLFGFLSEEDRNFFEKLISISGIGPKMAMGILGHIERHHLQTAIEQKNTTLLNKIPGIGKKTAERIIIELKDKLPLTTKQEPSLSCQMTNLSSDAVCALINLGYTMIDAQKAVTKVITASPKELSLHELLAKTLQSI
jgi:holliday junction DNA helicase RuvA